MKKMPKGKAKLKLVHSKSKCFGVTVGAEKHIVSKLETYYNSYMTFPEGSYTLPLALWDIGTYMWPDFDAFPYLVVNAPTKDCGKSRLGELLLFTSNNPVLAASYTAAAIYRTLDGQEATLLFDEAETLSNEVRGLMHSVLNSGYRRGQTIGRVIGGETVKYETYCPKAFFLIGDVYDTLRSRSIIIHLRRAGYIHDREKFNFAVAGPQGDALRKEIKALLPDASVACAEMYLGFKGADFLTDREEEIWTPLFVLCRYFAPGREQELRRIAADMAAEKTAPASHYVNLLGEERKAEDLEYGERLLHDVGTVLNGNKAISSVALVASLRDLETGPWRKFRGEGLTAKNLATMLSRFGLHPQVYRDGHGRKTSKTRRGYLQKDVLKALDKVK